MSHHDQGLASATRSRTFDRAEFEAILAEARAGAASRELDRELPYALVRRLVATGFPSSRVPGSAGGEGSSVETVFERLIEVAAADSNLAHVFRGHLAFVEQRLFEPDASVQSAWFERLLGGALVGNAQSEQTGTTDIATTLVPTDGGYLLNGRKYYTTGSIYADWIDLSARLGDVDHQVFAATATPGVTSIDDWAGFGQRLTGSGTTTFVDVLVPTGDVRPYAEDGPHKHAYLMAFFQLVLLAVVAGIARAALDDVVAYVRPRTRTFGVRGQSFPREDPLVQSVVGEISSVASAARAIVLGNARTLGVALDAHLGGDDDPTPLLDAQLEVYRAQQVVLPLVIDATAKLFEVGGASAVDTGLALDRHWRNARTIATHNPALQRQRALGAFELNGTYPEWLGALGK
jgi:alkylation response protein AidB-like acyl-CoA dehydrogenase